MSSLVGHARGVGGVMVVAAWLALGCGAAPPSPPPQSSAQRLNAEGVRRLDRGEIDGAEEIFRDALREAELVDDLVAQAETWNNLGAAAMARGNRFGAWACYASAIRLLTATGRVYPGEVTARSNLRSTLLAEGHPDEAQAQFEAAVRSADVLSAPRSALLPRVGLAAVALRRGQAAQAGQLAARIRQDAERWGERGAMAAALAVEAGAAEASGNLPEAMRKLEQALVIDRAEENPTSVRSDLRAMVRVAERMGDAPAAAALLLRCARVARNLDSFDEAEQDLVRAEELCPGESCSTLRSEIRLERGVISQARDEHARTHPETARPGGGSHVVRE